MTRFLHFPTRAVNTAPAHPPLHVRRLSRRRHNAMGITTTIIILTTAESIHAMMVSSRTHTYLQREILLSDSAILHNRMRRGGIDAHLSAYDGMVGGNEWLEVQGMRQKQSIPLWALFRSFHPLRCISACTPWPCCPHAFAPSSLLQCTPIHLISPSCLAPSSPAFFTSSTGFGLLVALHKGRMGPLEPT